MEQIFSKIDTKKELTYEDALKMLSVTIGSSDYYKLLNYGNEYARNTFDNKAVIFAQLGLDIAPCPIDCKFCKLAISTYDDECLKLSEKDILSKVNELISSGANEIFLMTTADYDPDYFLEIGSAVRNIMPPQMRLVANVADFDATYAFKLKEAGFTGVYHICRLGEETDTQATIKDRINTLDAIKKTDLDLYYCVEPIGPEHTNEQIADEIFRAHEYNVNVMAVMRRVCFSGSPMEKFGEINALKLALICAVSVLCVKPNRAMGVHEPEIISLISGANQIYAECGSNPRDMEKSTEQGRGFSVAKAQKMLLDAGWDL